LQLHGFGDWVFTRTLGDKQNLFFFLLFD
jgi:hypothetical protein